MKQFDLEKAIAGEPVVTRNGSPVRILCTDRVGDQYPIVALNRDTAEEYVCTTKVEWEE